MIHEKTKRTRKGSREHRPRALACHAPVVRLEFIRLPASEASMTNLISTKMDMSHD